MPARVLIVEDDAAMRELLLAFVAEVGYAAAGAASGGEALELFGQLRPDLVLLDVRLPDTSGLEVLRQLRTVDGRCPVVIMSSYQSASSVAQARSLGVQHYLTKPTPLPELHVLLDRILNESTVTPQPEVRQLDGVIGRSEAMQSVFRMVERIARTQATVLIRGESGTGKEVIARAIHRLSASADRPFVPVDCTHIPGNLMENELFGHVRGAYTDARSDKPGLLEAGDGGTLFFDEIGLLPLDLQAKLLGVLETRRFRRIGGTAPISVSVRFLAATNEDLEAAVQEGRFREDLYYRLNVVPLDLPPLRARGDDVLLLADHYLDVLTSLHGTQRRRLAPDAVAMFRTYTWPGNVRELKNVIERAVLMTDKRTMEAADLVLDQRARRGPGPAASQVGVDADGRVAVTLPPEGIPLQEVERAVISAALERTGGNISRAAELLQVSRDQIRYRMSKYQMKRPSHAG